MQPVPSFYNLDLTLDEASLVHKAEDLILENCMSEQGYEYLPSPFVPTAELVFGDRRWGLTDSDVAAAVGYSVDERVSQLVAESDSARAAEAEFFAGMTPAERDRYLMALEGSPFAAAAPVTSVVTATIPGSGRALNVTVAGTDDSCRHQLPEALGQEFALFHSLAASIGRARSDVDLLATADDLFQSAVRSWSDCFKERGFTADDPLDAMDRYQPVAAADSRAAATADVDCKHQSEFMSAWYDAIGRAERVVGRDIIPEIEYWRSVRSGILAAARRVIEER